jgi:hypothetical protein
LIDRYQLFGRTCCPLPHQQVSRWWRQHIPKLWYVYRSSILNTEAAGSSKLLLSLRHIVRHNIPEDSNLHCHNRENFKSYILQIVCFIYDGLKVFSILKTFLKQNIGDIEERFALFHKSTEKISW